MPWPFPPRALAVWTDIPSCRETASWKSSVSITYSRKLFALGQNPFLAQGKRAGPKWTGPSMVGCKWLAFILVVGFDPCRNSSVGDDRSYAYG